MATITSPATQQSTQPDRLARPARVPRSPRVPRRVVQTPADLRGLQRRHSGANPRLSSPRRGR